MKNKRRKAACTWIDYKTNTETAKELNKTPVLDKIQEYRRNWLQHINRMPYNRLLSILKHYRLTGGRNLGRPLKRLLDVRDSNGSTSDLTPFLYDDDDDEEEEKEEEGNEDDDDDRYVRCWWPLSLRAIFRTMKQIWM